MIEEDGKHLTYQLGDGDVLIKFNWQAELPYMALFENPDGAGTPGQEYPMLEEEEISCISDRSVIISFRDRKAVDDMMKFLEFIKEKLSDERRGSNYESEV